MAVLVVGLLLLLLAPYLQNRRESSRRLQCEKRLIELTFAMRRCELQQQHFPGYRNLQAVTEAGERAPTGWAFPILPLIGYNDETEQPGPWAPDHAKYGPDGAPELRGRRPTVYIPDFVCPSDALPANAGERANWLSFAANCGLPDVQAADAPADWPANGVFQNLFDVSDAAWDVRVTFDDVEGRDGAGNTLLLTENVDSGQWTDATESQVGFVWVNELVDGQPAPGKQLLRINQQRGQGDGSPRFARPASYHPGGVNASYCDKSTQFLSEDIDYLVLVRLMTPDDRALKSPGANRALEAPFRLDASPEAR